MSSRNEGKGKKSGEIISKRSVDGDCNINSTKDWKKSLHKNITNKIKVWRAKYAKVKQLLNMFGFGCNDVTKMVTAGEEQWNGLKNTKFYKYGNIFVKNFCEFTQLIYDDVADGSLAMSGGERSEANREMTEE